MNTSVALDTSQRLSQDRGAVIHLSDGVCLAVADGAGGISGGAEAAEIFLQTVSGVVKSITTEHGCASLLIGLDGTIFDDAIAGETTGLIVVVKTGVLFGASVGDSAAWLFKPDERVELTRGQPKKPFLGAGGVLPHTFSMRSPQGAVVAATDCLWKYVNIDAVHAEVNKGGADMARRLVDLARLKSGALPDDICVLTCVI